MNKLHLPVTELSERPIPGSYRSFGKSAALAAALCLAGPPVLAQTTDNNGSDVAPFEIARLIIEYNATDEDVGVQVLLDGGSYDHLNIFGPDGNRLLEIEAVSNLQEQGLTELFFESSEPSLAEVSLEEFLARFPEGEYEFEGEGIDGIPLEGDVMFTHTIPAEPFLVSPEEDSVVDPNNTVIMWEPVTQTIDASTDVEIIGYQVIVEREDPLRLANVRVFNADVGPSVTSVTVPPEFLEADTEYDFEVLAIEASGNQTLSSSSFTTAP